METETVYHRVQKHQVVPDRDLVIELARGKHTPMATISDPKSTTSSEPMPVPQALGVVTEEMALEPYYLEVVVVDEDGVWDDRWGKLVDHPSRLDSKSALSL